MEQLFAKSKYSYHSEVCAETSAHICEAKDTHLGGSPLETLHTLKHSSRLPPINAFTDIHVFRHLQYWSCSRVGSEVWKLLQCRELKTPCGLLKVKCCTSLQKRAFAIPEAPKSHSSNSTRNAQLERHIQYLSSTLPNSQLNLLDTTIYKACPGSGIPENFWTCLFLFV